MDREIQEKTAFRWNFSSKWNNIANFLHMVENISCFRSTDRLFMQAKD